jgi:hypothetical protein
VSQEDFERVQAKLAHNHQFASRNNTEHQYLLRGLISCGLCHLGCTGRTCENYRYYFCRGKNGVVQSCRDEKCSSRMIPANQVDELVWQDLRAVLTHPEVIEAALLRAQGGAWLPQELQARRENLRKAQLSVNQQVERLTEAYLTGIIPLEELKRRRQDLAQRQEAVASQVRQLEASAAHPLELAQVMSTIQEFCQRVQNGLDQVTFEQKRQLVELLIDRVIVTNEEVEIRYVIPTSRNSEQVRFCHLRLDYFHHPAQDKPGDDLDCLCIWIGAKQGHWLVSAFWIANKHPADGDRRDGGLIPESRTSRHLHLSRCSPIPADRVFLPLRRRIAEAPRELGLRFAFERIATSFACFTHRGRIVQADIQAQAGMYESTPWCFNKPPQESPVVDAWGGMRRSFSERRGEANSHREGIDRYQ